MTKLIDPGKCEHPVSELEYLGPQRGLHGALIGHWVHCRKCGTSKIIKEAA